MKVKAFGRHLILFEFCVCAIMVHAKFYTALLSVVNTDNNQSFHPTINLEMEWCAIVVVVIGYSWEERSTTIE
jgi:hypothetical protein